MAFIKKIDFSDISLLVVNLSVVAYAYANHLEMAWFFWVYWAQSVIIGIFNYFKILSLQNYDASGVDANGQRAKTNEVEKRWMANFFAMHYGFFHFIYFIFIIVIAGLGSLFRLDTFMAIAIFFCNHLISYLINNPRESKQYQEIGTLFFRPYLRIVPMHLVLIFGGLFFQNEAAIVLMLAKSIIDFVMHISEHAPVQPPITEDLPL